MAARSDAAASGAAWSCAVLESTSAAASISPSSAAGIGVGRHHDRVDAAYGRHDLPVRAYAGARSNELRGEQGGQLRVSVTQRKSRKREKPTGQSLTFSAASFACDRRESDIITGETSPRKKFLIRGLKPADLAVLIERASRRADEAPSGSSSIAHRRPDRLEQSTLRRISGGRRAGESAATDRGRCYLQHTPRRHAAKTKPTPAKAAKSSVDGSGTAAGLPLKLAPGANTAPAEDAEPEPIALESNASRLEPPSAVGEESAIGDELACSTASTRLSNRFASNPGSVAAKRSIAAMRFSSTWPVVLLIAPEAIAA